MRRTSDGAIKAGKLRAVHNPTVMQKDNVKEEKLLPNLAKSPAKEDPMPEYGVPETVVVAEKMLPYPATCLVDNLRTNGAQQDKRQRRISLERINTKMSKRRQSLPVLPTYLTIVSPKEKRSGKKERKEVTFPLGVLMQQVVTEGEIQELKDLLEKHGSKAVEEREPNGLPPIMRAIFEDQMECLKLLLAAGANLSAQDPEEWNALHVASAMDNMEAAKMILEAGGQQKGMTQSRNIDGERAIDLAESLEMSRLLLHADLAEFRMDCRTVGEHTSYTEKNEAEVLQLVKEYCETHSTSTALDEVLKENTCYSSLLHLAATKNYSRLADYVCTHWVPSLEVRDKKGWTPLHTAAYYNNVEMALLLVGRGANIHTITHSYQKPSDLTEHELILSLMEQTQMKC